jgi:hypothetical protein
MCRLCNSVTLIESGLELTDIGWVGRWYRSSMTLSSTSMAHLPQREMGGVKHQPEPPSRNTRSRCQGSAEAVSNIRWRRNVEHHPKHDMSRWGGQGSNLRPTDYESAALTD